MSRSSFFVFGKALSTQKIGKAKPMPNKAERKYQVRYTPNWAKQKPINKHPQSTQKPHHETVEDFNERRVSGKYSPTENQQEVIGHG